jgi:hypothetical protein
VFYLVYFHFIIWRIMLSFPSGAHERISKAQAGTLENFGLYDAAAAAWAWKGLHGMAHERGRKRRHSVWFPLASIRRTMSRSHNEGSADYLAWHTYIAVSMNSNGMATILEFENDIPSNCDILMAYVLFTAINTSRVNANCTLGTSSSPQR